MRSELISSLLLQPPQHRPMTDKGEAKLRSLGLGGVFKTLTKSLKPASGKVPVVINAKVVGGASDLQKLLQQLQYGSISLRVSAAIDITKSLETYSVSSIPEIWYLGRSLCKQGLSSSARRVAINLMVKCIKHDSLDVSSRLMYYRDILSFCDVSDFALDPEFNLFLEALEALTENGREIHDLCLYNQDRDWQAFVSQAFTSLEVLASSKSSHEMSAGTFACLNEFTSYLGSCFKFNSSILDEFFVASILQSLCSISLVSEDLGVLSSLSELTQIIATFAFIPGDLYASTISFVCSVAPLSPDLYETSHKTLSGIFLQSPLGALDAIMTVFHVPELQVLKGADLIHTQWQQQKDHKCILAAIGALSLLESMLLSCGSDDVSTPFDFLYEPLYMGCSKCLQLNIPIITSGILRIFDHLFFVTDDNSRAHHNKRFMTLFPFYAWYSSTNSIFQLLLRAKILTVQDMSYWSSICSSLRKRFTSSDFIVPADKIVELCLLHPDHIDDETAEFVLKYYKDNSLCTTTNASWKQDCRTLLTSFYFPTFGESKKTTLRIQSLDLIKDGYDRSLALFNEDCIGYDLLSLVAENLLREDESVLHHILHIIVYDILCTCNISSFRSILFMLSQMAKESHDCHDPSKDSSLFSHPSEIQSFKASSNGSLGTEKDKMKLFQRMSIEVGKLLGRLLVELYPTDFVKAGEIYSSAIELLASYLKHGLYRGLLHIIRVLIRLRSTSDGALFFCHPSDMNGLASTLKRNTSDESYTANESQWWCFPENLEYLPATLGSSLNNRFTNGLIQDGVSASDVVAIDLGRWLDLVIGILKDCVHWELYSYTVAHICSQLFNLCLFWDFKDRVLKIQNLVCDQIALKLPKNLAIPPYDSATKSDLQVALVRTLSSLIGYHDLFEKQNEDNIIKALLFGLGSWQSSAIPCIHMLTICCYEITESLKRYLIPILTKLQTGVTSVFASSSALEFLMALIHVPSLTTHFTRDEFRQVFAICFRYIEHSLNVKRRGFEEKVNGAGDRYLGHGIDAEVDSKASTQKTALTPITYQYLLTVSYAVITRWFLKIDVTERSEISSFIIKNIISCSGAKSINELDELTVSYIDVITRFTYSDIPLKIFRPLPSTSRGSMCRWLVGNSLVEIDTNVENGCSTITLRRPCGLSSFDLNLNQRMIPNNITLGPDRTLMLSSHLFLQLFKPLDQGNITKPVALLDDAYTERAINSFDRLPVVFHHKAGVIYIGPGQKDETEILSNTSGSSEYHLFLEGLGDMVKLDECDSIYTGGLDKENGTDGEHAYFWSDELTHLIYHTTTLMPNALNDKYLSMKKRHIGNNHVNIFFDESGLPFNFNVIKSQFNFLNVVLCPHTIKQDHSDPKRRKFYKVITYRRNGVPGIFSTTHFKLISLEQLPHLVRNIIIMSTRFSEIWHNLSGGVFTTNWELRVRHLNKLRQKTIEAHNQMKEEQASGPSGAKVQTSASKNTTLSFLEQLQPQRGEEGRAREKQSADSLVAGNENDLYSLLEFNSYT